MTFIATTWGRRIYITYLATAVPALGFTSFVTLFLLFGLAGTPTSEYPPMEEFDFTWQSALGLASCLGLPIAWTTALLTAHRFDRPRWRTFPFLLNLFPVGSLLTAITFSDSDADWFWVVLYFALLTALLIAGICLALQHHDTPADEGRPQA